MMPKDYRITLLRSIDYILNICEELREIQKSRDNIWKINLLNMFFAIFIRYKNIIDFTLFFYFTIRSMGICCNSRARGGIDFLYRFLEISQKSLKLSEMGTKKLKLLNLQAQKMKEVELRKDKPLFKLFHGSRN